MIYKNNIYEKFELVPSVGVEPTHPHGYKILSLARLPIPPQGHAGRIIGIFFLSSSVSMTYIASYATN
jgi:hypothetical protein